MNATRRGFCTGAVTVTAFIAVAGCVSDPGASCRGATVRLSLRPTGSIDSPLVFDSESLSPEAVIILETAIEDEHVEHCVSWDPSPDETGASAGLAEIADRIEAHTDTELPSETDRLDIAARFRSTAYTLSLVIRSDSSDGSR